jgi:hypothetical protein
VANRAGFGDTVRVMYSCALCGLQRVAVDVPAREADEDVMHWSLQTLAGAISVDHRRQSPGCQAKSITEVMIPLLGVDRVGDVPKH